MFAREFSVMHGCVLDCTGALLTSSWRSRSEKVYFCPFPPSVLCTCVSLLSVVWRSSFPSHHAWSNGVAYQRGSI